MPCISISNGQWHMLSAIRMLGNGKFNDSIGNDSRPNAYTTFTRKLICIELMEVKNQKGISIKPLDSRYVEIWYSHVFCLVCRMRRLHFHSAWIRISCELSSVCWIYRLTFHGGRMLSSTVILQPDSGCWFLFELCRSHSDRSQDACSWIRFESDALQANCI